MKKYVEPVIKVHKIKTMAILAGSPQGVTVKGLSRANGGNSIFSGNDNTTDDNTQNGWVETDN